MNTYFDAKAQLNYTAESGIKDCGMCEKNKELVWFYEDGTKLSAGACRACLDTIPF